MTKITAFALAIMMSFMLSGCGVGSPMHKTATYNRLQSEILRNNNNLMTIKIGMTQEQVLQHMGHGCTAQP
jgi:outer membrane protein assembly factor BamE (lipoprotein component of BamABCDE complex)